MFRRISSRQNDRIARYRRVARGDEPALMLLDGEHLVAEAAAAPITIRHVLVSSEAAELPAHHGLLDRLDQAGVEIAIATAPVIAAASPVRSPSPIVALADRPAAADVFRLAPPLVVIAADVQDPGNLGAILRVAEAGGASGVIAAGRSADPFGWKALRGSMGSALRLPIAAADVDSVVAESRRRNCRVVATSPRGGRSIFDADLGGPLAVLIGGEGAGLPRPLVDTADEHVTIPMEPPVESLNAAVTAALILYEVRRRRSHARTLPARKQSAG
jgi:TrmH family RNA methyltransferase